MARPHIEFIHSRDLPWNWEPLSDFRPDVQIKQLSCDSESGALSLLARYPAGWHLDSDHSLTSPEEFYVLEGDLQLGDTVYTQGCYAYLPAGWSHAQGRSKQGALVLAFYEARPTITLTPGPNPSRDEAIPRLNCFELPWDMLNMNPGVAYLNMARKNLRLAPNNGGRTYLLTGMPHGQPPEAAHPLERHPYAEEAFMISGDLASTFGVMRAGAYLWRPAELWHGGLYSVSGFLTLVRTPGSNDPIIEWSDNKAPLDPHPPYCPVLPDEIAPYARDNTDVSDIY